MSDEALSQDPLHPRRTTDLLGHAAAEANLLDAYRSGRLPHAWLISGPKGIGKATLAFRFARFLLAEGGQADEPAAGLFGPGDAPQANLDMAPDNPVFRRVAAEGHADLLTVERSVNERTGKLRGEISVEDVRKLPGFFSLTAAEGGYRVAIVDSADEMNRHAANALLKILEEPPARAVLLIIANAPGGLLPTIRSRCRRLTLRPLDDATVAEVLRRRLPETEPAELATLAKLAEGSPGRAISLARLGGVAVYRDLIDLLKPLPELDFAALHAFGDKLGRRENQPAFQAMIDLLSWWLTRLVRFAAAASPPPEIAGGEGALAQRLSQGRGLDRWLEVWEKVCRLVERADSINLDRKQVVLNVFTALSRAAKG